MRTFAEIEAIAIEHKGTQAALEESLPQPASDKTLRQTTDDRYLAAMTRCVFNSGFVWKVIAAKWPDFETVFAGFNPRYNASLSDEQLEIFATDTRIVRHFKKISAVRDNATFVMRVAEEHGSFGRYISDWPQDDVVGLLKDLKQRGSRLGGNTGMYFLRFIGKDTFMLSRDVVKTLIDEAIVSKQPTSQRDMQAVQDAFNQWQAESGRPLCHISRILAASQG